MYALQKLVSLGGSDDSDNGFDGAFNLQIDRAEQRYIYIYSATPPLQVYI